MNSTHRMRVRGAVPFLTMLILLSSFCIVAWPTAGDADPPTAEPVQETPDKHVWNGHLACSVSFTTGYHPINCPGSVFDEHDDRHDLEVEPGFKSVVVAMDWHVPTIAFTDTMRNWLYVDGQSWVRNLGPPPMEFRYDAPEGGSPTTDLEFRVWAGGGGGNLNVVHDLDFTVHYHVFQDERAPDDYSALP